MKKLILPAVFAACLVLTGPARAVMPNDDELAEAQRWAATRFEGVQAAPAEPFSFVYGGKPSSELLETWRLERTSGSGLHTDRSGPSPRPSPPPGESVTGKGAPREIGAGRALGERTLTWTDPQTGLQVRCVVVEYHDFPTVEWTLYFKNTGTADTPIVENIQALDVHLEREARGEFLLHHNVGSPANGNDYGPLETALGPNAIKRISAAGGRPTNSDLSYFNLDWGGKGLILVVGWPGQWAAEFARDAGRGLHLRAGQELTHFKLSPGEEIRSPLVVVQFWNGDWIHAQNIWRRWMMAHSMPTPGGKLPQPQFLASSSRQYDEMIKADEQKEIMFIRRYLEERLKLDYWWMDAGWYLNYGSGWPRVGTWEVDTNRFPRGLRPVSDYAHEHGIKILVWFEPERVAAGTWLTEHHPEWILGGAKGGLLNLGNEDARHWLTEHVDRLLTEQGIDLYRQDFNMDPLNLWRANDALDRQGITEIKHVTGYLAYWDELRRRHPNMLIDSCASGGRRNDLETMRRAVPLWRSDYAYEPIGHQCMTDGISMWLPYQGTGTVAARNAPYYGSGRTPIEPYAFWSNVAPSLGCGIDIRVKEIDYAKLRGLLDAWRRISANYYGDFYPLTPWTRDDKAWMAWQFDRPEAGEGIVQAFRRDKSFYESARLKLRGLEANARYVVANIERAGERRAFTGQELMERGLPLVIAEQPGAAVLSYQRRGRSVNTIR